MKSLVATLIDNPDSLFVGCAKVFVAYCVSEWLAAPALLRMVGVLCLVDVITALVSAEVRVIARIRRVVLTIILTLTVQYFYTQLKVETQFNIGFDLASMVAGFFIIQELIVITNNCSDGGTKLPPKWMRFLKRAEGVLSADEVEDAALNLRQSQERTALAKLQDDRRDSQE